MCELSTPTWTPSKIWFFIEEKLLGMAWTLSRARGIEMKKRDFQIIGKRRARKAQKVSYHIFECFRTITGRKNDKVKKQKTSWSLFYSNIWRILPDLYKPDHSIRLQRKWAQNIKIKVYNMKEQHKLKLEKQRN